MKPGSEDVPFTDDDEEDAGGSGREQEASVVDGDNGNTGVPPYAIRRSSVKEDRVKVPFWTRDEERLGDVKGEVEELLGYEVYQTDFKEAVLLDGLANPERVAERLDEWGCEYA